MNSRIDQQVANFIHLYREDSSQYDIRSDRGFHQQREKALIEKLRNKVQTDAERIAVDDYLLILENAYAYNLNWRQCRLDNQILALLEKYNLV